MPGRWRWPAPGRLSAGARYLDEQQSEWHSWRFHDQLAIQHTQIRMAAYQLAERANRGVRFYSGSRGVAGQSSILAPMTATWSASASAGRVGSRPVSSLTRASR